MKLANGTMSLWSSSTTAFNSGLDMAKSFFSSQQPPRATSSVDVHMNEDGIPVPEKEDEPAALANAEAGPSRKPYWGQFPCCLSCVSALFPGLSLCAHPLTILCRPLRSTWKLRMLEGSAKVRARVSEY